MVSAFAYGSKASAGFPSCDNRRPIALWLAASSFWNWVTAGFASASFCRVGRAFLYAFRASAGLPGSIIIPPIFILPQGNSPLDEVTGGVAIASLRPIGTGLPLR